MSATVCVAWRGLVARGRGRKLVQVEVSLNIGLRLGSQSIVYIDERQIHDVNEMNSHQFRRQFRLLIGLSVCLFVYAL